MEGIWKVAAEEALWPALGELQIDWWVVESEIAGLRLNKAVGNFAGCSTSRTLSASLLSACLRAKS